MMTLYENDIDYAVEKFRLKVGGGGETPLVRCYRNRLTYGCGYIPAIEKAIDAVLERDDDDELWWLAHLT